MKRILVCLLMISLLSLTLYASPSSKSSEIITAVSKKDAYTLKMLVSENPEESLVILKDGNELNIYKYVIDMGNVGLLKVLLEAGVDPNACFESSNSLYSPFSYAMKKKKSDMAQLLASDERVLINNEEVDSPLAAFVLAENKEMISLFVKLGVDPNIPFSYYGTKISPISYAVKIKNSDLLEYFLSLDSIDIDGSMGYYPSLFYAIENDDEKMVAKLVENGADPAVTFTYYNTTYNALGYAIYKKKSFNLINSMIIKDSEALVAKDCNSTPLYNAVYNNDQSVVEALVKAGADVSVTFEEYNTIYDAVSYALSRKKSDAVVNALLASDTCDLKYKRISNSPYYYALDNKNPAMVKALIDRGYDPNRAFFTPYSTSTKYSPLSYAIGQNLDISIITSLVNAKGIDLNGRGSDYPPIYYAIYNKNIEALALLIEKGCNVNKTFLLYGNVHTPLSFAYDSTIISMLIAAGASYYPVQVDTPFKDIVDNEDVERLKETAAVVDDINEVFEVDSREYSILDYALTKKVSTDFLKELLSVPLIDIDGEYSPNTPIAIALEKKDLESLKLLISSGADVNSKVKFTSGPYTPLVYVTQKMDIAFLETLLESDGIDIYEDELDYTPMYYAIQRGDKDILKSYLDHGYDINHEVTSGYSLLAYAIRCKSEPSIIKMLLDTDGIDVDGKSGKYSPLEVALDNKNMEVLKQLFAKGVSKDTVCPYSYGSKETNGLGYAVSSRMRMSFIYALADYGMDIDAKGFDYPPIYYAIKNNDLEALQYLLSQGADPNVTIGNYSIIEYAIDNNKRLSIIEALLDAGCDINEGVYYSSPMFMAVKKHDSEVLELLIKRGADLSKTVSIYGTNYSLIDFMEYSSFIDEDIIALISE